MNVILAPEDGYLPNKILSKKRWMKTKCCPKCCPKWAKKGYNRLNQGQPKKLTL